MRILGIIFAVTGVVNLVMGYYVTTDKKKPSKMTQVINYIIITLLLFSSAINAFLR